MELELGLALPTATPPRPPAGKRAFGDAKATLPLFFVRDEDDGGGGDDHGGGGGGGDHETSNNRKRRLVGWPPVKCAHRRRSVGRYVKVSMEGVAIGRKVDVSLHGSYGDLLRTLRRMFLPYDCEGGDGGGGGGFVVTYEDGEGDWLLVGDDVPWEAFAKSVKRLKILAYAVPP
ncbi:hypothetical protein U9M48_029626 [Paspalum notatum var. saurae]|uniref:Auxin-responsive protein n=1 Tax=Paspalum notatum var. saurae TaxID=547442 RepID=A0AAQ3TZ87_PASNO